MGQINRRTAIKTIGAGLISTIISGCQIPEYSKNEKTKKQIIGPYIQNVCQNQATICWIGNGNGELHFDGGGRGLEIKIHNNIINQVTLEDLKPGQTYEYSVGNKKRKFKTPTEIGDFSFVVYGDNQTHPKKHKRLIKQITELNPSFIVHVGDCVEDGWKFHQFIEFLKEIEPISGEIPYYISIGNHERNASEYFKLFAFPGNKRYYKLERGCCNFLFLDSNKLKSALNFNKNQFDFLKQNINKEKINIAVFHHPVYGGSKPTTFQRKFLRKNIKNRLKDIKLVFNGHEHNYQRHEKNNITYVITGGGGGDLHTSHPNDTCIKYAKKHNFINVNVKNNKSEPELELSVIGDKSDLIDSFKIRG